MLPIDIGRMDIECPHSGCCALMFEFELLSTATRRKPAFGTKCCHGGKIKMPDVDTPRLCANPATPGLAEVFTPSHPLGIVYMFVEPQHTYSNPRTYRKYCIELNRAFAMSGTIVTRVYVDPRGARTFKIQGPATPV